MCNSRGTLTLARFALKVRQRPSMFRYCMVACRAGWSSSLQAPCLGASCMSLQVCRARMASCALAADTKIALDVEASCSAKGWPKPCSRCVSSTMLAEPVREGRFSAASGLMVNLLQSFHMTGSGLRYQMHGRCSAGDTASMLVIDKQQGKCR